MAVYAPRDQIDPEYLAKLSQLYLAAKKEGLNNSFIDFLGERIVAGFIDPAHEASPERLEYEDAMDAAMKEIA